MIAIELFLIAAAKIFVVAPVLACFLRVGHLMLISWMEDNGAWRDAVVDEFGEYYTRNQVLAMKKSAEFRGDMYSVIRCNRVLNG